MIETLRSLRVAENSFAEQMKTKIHILYSFVEEKNPS